MKKFTLFSLCLWLLSSSPLLAQTSWTLGGNMVSASQRLGTNGNYSLILETSNTERARLTGAGLLGVGTTAPNAKLHINSAAGQSPFRVQINGSTKLWLNPDGGLAIGIVAPAPRNGLLVDGDVGIGTTTPYGFYKLHVVSNISGGTAVYGEGTRGVFGKGVTGIEAYSDTDGGNGIWVTTRGFANYGIYTASDQSYGIYAKTNNPDSFAGYFEGNVYTSGSYQPSDEKLKRNITEVGNATSLINQLKPKNYEYKTEGDFGKMNLPPGQQFGFLSQELEQVLPGLVKQVHHTKKQPFTHDGAAAGQQAKEEVLDFKAVNYTGLIPIMIKGMQEQEAKIDKQERIISTLIEKITKLEAGNSTGSTFKLTPADLIGVSLEQNYPNPTGSKTTFRYTVPSNAKAQILIYNSTSGKLVKSLPAPVKGQIDMDTSDLEAGTYIYTLEVNGKQTAAKQLMLSK